MCRNFFYKFVKISSMYLLELDAMFTCTSMKYCANHNTQQAIGKHKSELQRMCVDDLSCKAIEYFEGKGIVEGRGNLCTSTSFLTTTGEIFGHSEACAISRSKYSHFKLV